METFELDADTAVSAVAEGCWRGEVTDRWDVPAGPPNGGYVLAVAARAMAQAADQPHPVSVTAHFLAPARHEVAEIETEVVRRGGRHATIAAALRQDDTEVLRVLGTFADLDRAEGPSATLGAPPELPPVEACQAPPDAPGLFRRFDYRSPAEDVHFTSGPSGRGEVRTWLRFADGRRADPLGLVVIADASAPAVWNLPGVTMGWVPTIELTVQVRQVPVPGWVRCRATSRFLVNGYVEEDVEVWDSADRLVALARQLALAPRA